MRTFFKFKNIHSEASSIIVESYGTPIMEFKKIDYSNDWKYLLNKEFELMPWMGDDLSKLTVYGAEIHQVEYDSEQSKKWMEANRCYIGEDFKMNSDRWARLEQNDIVRLHFNNQEYRSIPELFAAVGNNDRYYYDLRDIREIKDDLFPDALTQLAVKSDRIKYLPTVKILNGANLISFSSLEELNLDMSDAPDQLPTSLVLPAIRNINGITKLYPEMLSGSTLNSLQDIYQPDFYSTLSTKTLVINNLSNVSVKGLTCTDTSLLNLVNVNNLTTGCITATITNANNITLCGVGDEKINDTIIKVLSSLNGLRITDGFKKTITITPPSSAAEGTFDPIYVSKDSQPTLSIKSNLPSFKALPSSYFTSLTSLITAWSDGGAKTITNHSYAVTENFKTMFATDTFKVQIPFSKLLTKNEKYPYDLQIKEIDFSEAIQDESLPNSNTKNLGSEPKLYQEKDDDGNDILTIEFEAINIQDDSVTHFIIGLNELAYESTIDGAPFRGKLYFEIEVNATMEINEEIETSFRITDDDSEEPIDERENEIIAHVEP